MFILKSNYQLDFNIFSFSAGGLTNVQLRCGLTGNKAIKKCYKSYLET